MEEKKRFSKRDISLIVCMFFIMLAFVVNGVVQVRDYAESKKPGARSVAAQQPVVDKNEGKTRYTVRLYHGTIAVFNDGNPDTPIQITDISQDTLRTYDKEQLESGIIVYGDTELAMILEDFGS